MEAENAGPFGPDVIAKVREKHPSAELRLLTASGGDDESASAIFKAPSRAEYKRFRTMLLDPGQRPHALEALVFGCVVHPPPTELTAIFERRPVLTEKFGEELLEWAGGAQEVTQKKL